MTPFWKKNILLQQDLPICSGDKLIFNSRNQNGQNCHSRDFAGCRHKIVQRRVFATILWRTWPTKILQKSLRIIRQLVLKIITVTRVILVNASMGKMHLVQNLLAVLSLSKLPHLSVMFQKRNVIIVGLILLFLILMSMWNGQSLTTYNKWQLSRYVESATKRKIAKVNNNSNDYLISFLAHIISNKHAITQICDELEIESCSNASR